MTPCSGTWTMPTTPSARSATSATVRANRSSPTSSVPACLTAASSRGSAKRLAVPSTHNPCSITSTGIDAANSLYAIKHLIYDTKQLTWEQLKKALAANFEGYEDIQKLCFEHPSTATTSRMWTSSPAASSATWSASTASHGPDYFGYEAHMDPFLSYHNHFAP